MRGQSQVQTQFQSNQEQNKKHSASLVQPPSQVDQVPARTRTRRRPPPLPLVQERVRLRVAASRRTRARSACPLHREPPEIRPPKPFRSRTSAQTRLDKTDTHLSCPTFPNVSTPSPVHPANTLASLSSSSSAPGRRRGSAPVEYGRSGARSLLLSRAVVGRGLLPSYVPVSVNGTGASRSGDVIGRAGIVGDGGGLGFGFVMNGLFEPNTVGCGTSGRACCCCCCLRASTCI